MKYTNTFWKNVDAKKRYVFNQGGTWSGKTYGELQKEIIIAMQRKVLTSCISESFPHLRMGMIKDFKEIMTSEGWFDTRSWNKTESAYTFPNGSVMEFFSADNAGKVHGGRRDRLLVNEIQNISYEIFHQASMRTKEQITADYNPTSSFWVHDNFINNPDYEKQIDYIHSTYKDNPYIPDAVIKDILTRAKHDENYRRVYIEGLPGIFEGLIFTNWEIISEMPKDFKWVIYGIDFGFVNDPTAIVKVGMANGEIYLDELCYETDLVNIPNPMNKKSIIDKMNESGIKRSDVIYADSAEQKSITEINTHGYTIRSVKKPQNSINLGIDVMKRYKLNVTKRSLNLIKELRNYQWSIDKLGNTTNKPIDNFNHCIDAVRYVMFSKLGQPLAQLRGSK